MPTYATQQYLRVVISRKTTERALSSAIEACVETTSASKNGTDRTYSCPGEVPLAACYVRSPRLRPVQLVGQFAIAHMPRRVTRLRLDPCGSVNLVTFDSAPSSSWVHSSKFTPGQDCKFEFRGSPCPQGIGREKLANQWANRLADAACVS